MEARIRSSLFELIRATIPDFNDEDIDEIVTSYVQSILEDLVDEVDPLGVLDCEAFKEMMVAYLPQSELVKEDEMMSWLGGLVKELQDERNAKECRGFDIKSIISETTRQNSTSSRKSRTVSETSDEVDKKHRSGIIETSEGEAGGAHDAGVSALLEMFPNCCHLEAVHCLTVTGGNLEEAAQLIITRAELGQEFKPSQAQMLSKLSKPAAIDDNQMKKKIMEQYGFVDKEEDERYHRPSINNKHEDKKLIRYREGKIVSTKGERFSQITKEESQELKKTIVNILTSQLSA